MPVPSVIESWSGMSRGKAAGQGDSGVKVFSVVGAISGDNALSLVSAAGTYVNVEWNASDPNNVMRCQSVVANFTGPILSTVVASFAVPPRGYYQATVKPTDQKWLYKWGQCVEDEQMDRDIDNHPILNAAWDPPSNPPRTTVIKDTLQITRFEDFYDYPLWRYYRGAVNSDSIDLLMPTGETTNFPAGTIKLQTAVPAVAYTTDDTFLPMELNFELLDLSVINPALTDPWQLHLLNAGSSCYFGDGKKRGRILYASALQPVDMDVPLGGDGKPIDSSLLVSGTGGEAERPVAPARGLPPGAMVETVGTGDYQVTFLKWKKCRSVPFLPLLTPGGL